MKLKIFLVMALFATMLTACSNPKELKLSEINETEKSQVLLDSLTPEERGALTSYLVKHSMTGDLDENVTVGEAIKESLADAKKIEENAEKTQPTVDGIK